MRAIVDRVFVFVLLTVSFVTGISVGSRIIAVNVKMKMILNQNVLSASYANDGKKESIAILVKANDETSENVQL